MMYLPEFKINAITQTGEVILAFHQHQSRTGPHDRCCVLRNTNSATVQQRFSSVQSSSSLITYQPFSEVTVTLSLIKNIKTGIAPEETYTREEREAGSSSLFHRLLTKISVSSSCLLFLLQTSRHS